MKTTLKLFVLGVLLAASCARAQNGDTPQSVLHQGAQQYEVFVSGGTGVGHRSGTQYIYGGGRWGKIITGEHLGGAFRGNFEYVVDVIPFIAFYQPVQNAHGAGFTPFLLKWNFTRGRRLVPYFEIGGGVIFTNHDVPHNTNPVNFTPQGGLGVHILRGNNRAITFSGEYMHVSNASLANHNTGINASIKFLLGYTWFK